MIINAVLKALGQMRIPCKFEQGDEMSDDAINILNHPLELHIQFTPYSPSPFQIGYWEDAQKVSMRFQEFHSVNDLINAIKELL